MRLLILVWVVLMVSACSGGGGGTPSVASNISPHPQASASTAPQMESLNVQSSRLGSCTIVHSTLYCWNTDGTGWFKPNPTAIAQASVTKFKIFDNTLAFVATVQEMPYEAYLDWFAMVQVVPQAGIATYQFESQGYCVPTNNDHMPIVENSTGGLVVSPELLVADTGDLNMASLLQATDGDQITGLPGNLFSDTSVTVSDNSDVQCSVLGNVWTCPGFTLTEVQ